MRHFEYEAERPSSPSHTSNAESVVVRFAGDSGDGVQLVGQQFSLESALSGNDFATFPDFPAEIRAPVGTTFGVSAFQIQFGSIPTRTAGDAVDVLFAFNPAALQVNIKSLRSGGLLVVDEHSFTERNLRKAGYPASPLDDHSLGKFQVLRFNIDRMTREAVAHCELSNREAGRTKNFWALGMALWLCGKDRNATRAWVSAKFGQRPEIERGNLAALDAGHAFAETAELPSGIRPFNVGAAPLAPGEYRNINGTQALCFGLAAAAGKASLPLLYCSYPITPASNMLHVFAAMEDLGVTTFQAEDEIAAICAALGAAYAGRFGVTGSSGPGLALKTEALGLAICTELPLVVVNAQRGGPSTGLPTKTEQSDLFQAVHGRNGDSPLPVVASRSPGDCFECAFEATRLAIKYRTPVILLTDGYLANASEPWAIPSLEVLPAIDAQPVPAAADLAPYSRDPTTLARPWIAPGTPGAKHRIGGLEKADVSGHISYDPDNHQRMSELRAKKIAIIANDIPEQTLDAGRFEDDVLVLSWGSVYGAAATAVARCSAEGYGVAHAHLRHLNPFPRNLEALLENFDQVLIPELNGGQLRQLVQAQCGRTVGGLSKIAGQPFTVEELVVAIKATIRDEKSSDICTTPEGLVA